MKVLKVEIYAPEKKINSSDFKEFRKCLDEGFFVVDHKDGYRILRKKTKILVTIEYQNQQFKRNLKSNLAAIYGRDKADQKLVELLEEDLKNDMVTIKMDSKGYFLIVKK